MPAPDLSPLRAFRTALHDGFVRRADALFEVGDALLEADRVTSWPHLSLPAAHRRGWGRRSDALTAGRIDVPALRLLLGQQAASVNQPVSALDLSVWPRCDAEASPERGYSDHPSRHSAGQPIVAGWASQWLVQLTCERDSGTTPRDARRVHPTQNTNRMALNQITDLLSHLPRGGTSPLFVFDAG